MTSFALVVWWGGLCAPSRTRATLVACRAASIPISTHTLQWLTRRTCAILAPVASASRTKPARSSQSLLVHPGLSSLCRTRYCSRSCSARVGCPSRGRLADEMLAQATCDIDSTTGLLGTSPKRRDGSVTRQPGSFGISNLDLGLDYLHGVIEIQGIEYPVLMSTVYAHYEPQQLTRLFKVSVLPLHEPPRSSTCPLSPPQLLPLPLSLPQTKGTSETFPCQE